MPDNEVVLAREEQAPVLEKEGMEMTRDFSQYAEQDERDRERAERIARETGEFPLIKADYRRMFALCADRDEAVDQCAGFLMQRPQPAERRLGSITDRDIRQALEEAWPQDD